MKSIEKRVLKYLKDRKWDDLMPANIAKSIMIEGAELLELFQWHNLSLKDVRKNKDLVQKISKELADVLIYTLDMVVLLGLDSEKIVREKIAHIDKKYPAKLMREKARKDSGSGGDSIYMKIKKEYRMKGE